MDIFNRAVKNSVFTASEFAEKVDVDGVYVHLRIRGFSRFESFAASYAELYAGRPSDIEAACAALEETDRFKDEMREVLKGYAREELFAFWDKQMSLAKVKPSIAAAQVREIVAAKEDRELEGARADAQAMRDLNKGDAALLEEKYQRMSNAVSGTGELLFATEGQT